jgi:hypothetical protein
LFSKSYKVNNLILLTLSDNPFKVYLKKSQNEEGY